MDKYREEMLKRAIRVEGLVRKVQEMIRSDAELKDIVQQIRAARGALKRAELETMRIDLEALKTGKGKTVDQLIDAIWKMP